MRVIRLLGLIGLIGIVGCASKRPGDAVPADLIGVAEQPGFEDARFNWEDDSQRLARDVEESYAQERVALGLAPNATELPRAHYLVISGGGQDGAFGAGLLYGWSESGTRPEFKVVTGVSTGALIAPFAFVGPEMDQSMKDVYTTISSKDIMHWHRLITMLHSDAAADDRPLEELIARHVTEAVLARIAAEHLKGRRLFIGTTNIDAQRLVIWDMGRIALSENPDKLELFRKVLLASATIPGAFPPQYFDVETPDGRKWAEMHVDGSVVAQFFFYPVKMHITDVRKEAHVQRETSVYVLRNSRYLPEPQEVHPRIASLVMRSMSTMLKSQSYLISVMIYDMCLRDGLDFYLVSIPEHVKASAHSMFDQQYMNSLFEIGRKMGSGTIPWRRSPYDPQATTRPILELPKN